LDALKKLTEDNIASPNKVNSKILNIIASKDVLVAAYMRIKSIPGNMTPGVGSETLDGINEAFFDNLARDVRSGAWKPKPARRVDITKPTGGVRTMNITSPRDKIVQEAVRFVLNVLYEPSFSDNSHGFRPNRSCHTALRQVYLKFGQTVWFIEGDISKCFDSIDHHKLAVILSKRIADKGFFDLYWKLVRAGYVVANSWKGNEVGTPQGSIVSPILSNIFLHELDNWIETYRKNFDKGDRRKQNLETKILRRGRGSAALARKLNMPSFYPLDPGFRRLKYVRYADDFLIGIIGPKEKAEKIVADLHIFLKEELNLDLNIGKTSISHASYNGSFFLGTIIKIVSVSGRQIKEIRSRFFKKTSLSRVTHRPMLIAPIRKLFDKLIEKGFAHPTKRTPTRLGWLIHFTEEQIISHYNSVYLGIYGYYSFAMNKALIHRLHYILKYSCALTLASKFRLRTLKKVFSKFGPDLTIVKNGKVTAAFAKYERKPATFNSTRGYNPFKLIERYFL
jgi:group II intron reverse transcriptase/maturase